MVNILVNTELNRLIDVHNLLNQLKDSYSKSKNSEFVLDLSRLSFVSPIGAIALLQLFEEFSENANCEIIVPKYSGNLVTYIERMNFFEHCPEDIFQKFDERYNLNKICQRSRNDQRKVLLEITKIVDYDDIDILYDSVVYLLRSHEMKGEQITRIANIFTELGTNIIDHSGNTGYAAIQYYPSFGKIMIGIADNGSGIVKGIREAEDGLGSDLEVIEKAFSGGYTSSVDTDRGWGLTDARDYSHEGAKRTTFELRTHKGLYNVGKSEIELISEDRYYPGTYFLIEIDF